MCEKKIPKWAAMAHAWANGEKIQYRDPRRAAPQWEDYPYPWCPSFLDAMEYRVKVVEEVRYAQLRIFPDNKIQISVPWSLTCFHDDNVKGTFNAETGELLAVEMLK